MVSYEYTEKVVRSDEITEDNGIIHRCDRGRQVCTQRRRQYNTPINVTQASTYVIMYRFVLLVSFAPFDQFGV